MRERLLEVSLRLFVAHGFRGTSLQDIAREAGCSKASLTYHFAGKQAILGELLEPVTGAAAELEKRLADVPDDRVVETAVRGLVDVALQYRQELALLLSDVAEVSTLPGFGDTPAGENVLVELLAGRSDRPADRLRAWMALGAIAIGTAGGRELPADQVREEMVRGMLRLLSAAD